MCTKRAVRCSRMIISHTVNVNGQRRIYIGAQSSIEIWLEPKEDGKRWSVRHNASGLAHLEPRDLLHAVIAQMVALAQTMQVTPQQLDTMTFDAIAAFHSTSSTRERRIPSPQRDMVETGYMVTPPGVQRSKNDFSAPDFHKYHTKGRSRGSKA